MAGLSTQLVKGGYDCVLYDQRGHGQSGGVRTHIDRFSDFVADLELLRKEEQGRENRSLYAFGHSLGSIVLLQHVLQDPFSWRGIIVSGSPMLRKRELPARVKKMGRLLTPLVPGIRIPTKIEPADLSSASWCSRCDVRKLPIGFQIPFLAIFNCMDRSSRCYSIHYQVHQWPYFSRAHPGNRGLSFFIFYV